MITILLLCIAGVVVIPILLAILSVPLTIIVAVLPWLLRVAGVVLLIKGLLDKPVRWENFTPAIGAFVLSVVLRWIF